MKIIISCSPKTSSWEVKHANAVLWKNSKSKENNCWCILVNQNRTKPVHPKEGHENYLCLVYLLLSQTAGPPTACHLSDVRKSRMKSHTCMQCRPVGESDVSRFWQDSLGTALSQRADSQKHMQGTCASHLIHRRFLICPCRDQSTADKAWVTEKPYVNSDDVLAR